MKTHDPIVCIPVESLLKSHELYLAHKEKEEPVDITYVCFSKENFRTVVLLSDEGVIEEQEIAQDLTEMDLKIKHTKDDEPVKKQIADNLLNAIKKRVNSGKFKSHGSKIVTQQVFYELIADDFGSSVRAVKDVMQGKKSLSAEWILYFERKWGIDRDELLGSVKRKNPENLALKRLNNLMESDYDVKVILESFLEPFSIAVKKIDKDRMDEVCEKLGDLLDEVSKGND